MMKDSRLPKEAQIEALRLRGKGVGWKPIGRYLGYSYDVVRYSLDPEYRQRRLKKADGEFRDTPPPLLYKDKLLDSLRAFGHKFAE